MSRKLIRCAIYTRKSTEEGLEQEFNSLDAQREACEAYIKSQKAEGWTALKDRFDDGGFSGGNMDRPALQRLLQSIEKGLVDTVVIYKIDRLTRSLSDFAKIVERFDKRNVSFVSVTQAFNTTSSMGRLTLNILLSFAQFEREVTAERIRDKFSASRKKGIFMGGCPPLGYDARERKLIINEREAETVRSIYTRYLELPSVIDLRSELDARGIRTKSRVTLKGQSVGGGRWYVGSLRHVLRNRVYVGESVYKGASYPGQHDAIVPRELFDAVQAKLDTSRIRRNERQPVHVQALLAGLVFDNRGNALTPITNRRANGSTYRYYVSQARIQRREPDAMRPIPAPFIEDLVIEQVARVLEIRKAEGRDNLRKLVTRVEIGAGSLSVSFDRDGLAKHTALQQNKLAAFIRGLLRPNEVLLDTDQGLVFTTPVTIHRRGGARRIEGGKSEGATSSTRHDANLIKWLVEAHRWREWVEAGEITSIEELATRTRHDRKFVRRTFKFAFLSPTIQRAILEGRQARSLTLGALDDIELPLLWSEQTPALFTGEA